MIYIHCQVSFKDYPKWKASMDADGPVQLKAGLRLIHLWRGVEDPNRAFFVLEVDDKQKARDFLNPANVAEAESEAGAMDFEWHFVEEIAVSET
jgi:hypothetical protein